jgi:hypothetical protein
MTGAAPGEGEGPAGDSPAAEEPPPILGRWRNLYILVLVTLAALIALFALLTRIYS